MTISSMTGFARAEGGAAGFGWAWELKSVNGKGLDIRTRLPSGFEHLDVVFRGAAQKAFKRGNLSVSVSLTRPRTAPQLRINRPLLDQLIALVREIEGEDAAPRVDQLLGLRGVVEEAEEDESEEARAARDQAMTATMEQALATLGEVRRQEGAQLEKLVRGQLAEIGRLCGAAEREAAVLAETLKDRLAGQVAQLIEAGAAGANIGEDRLAQELALLAVKADIREELDRLAAHIESAGELLDGGGAIGRKLDFLCQEFNREANTLCSKAATVALKNIGVELKVTIDQLREQAQNIE